MCSNRNDGAVLYRYSKLSQSVFFLRLLTWIGDLWGANCNWRNFLVTRLHESLNNAKSMPSVGAIHFYRTPTCVFRLLVKNAGKCYPCMEVIEKHLLAFRRVCTKSNLSNLDMHDSCGGPNERLIEKTKDTIRAIFLLNRLSTEISRPAWGWLPSSLGSDTDGAIRGCSRSDTFHWNIISLPHYNYIL